PDPSGGAIERGVTEAEDAAVSSDQPVPVAGWGGSHSDDGLVQPDPSGRAVEVGVAEAEDSPVCGHEPVPLPGRRWRRRRGWLPWRGWDPWWGRRSDVARRRGDELVVGRVPVGGEVVAGAGCGVEVVVVAAVEQGVLIRRTPVEQRQDRAVLVAHAIRRIAAVAGGAGMGRRRDDRPQRV